MSARSNSLPNIYRTRAATPNLLVKRRALDNKKKFLLASVNVLLRFGQKTRVRDLHTRNLFDGAASTRLSRECIGTRRQERDASSLLLCTLCPHLSVSCPFRVALLLPLMLWRFTDRYDQNRDKCLSSFFFS